MSFLVRTARLEPEPGPGPDPSNVSNVEAKKKRTPSPESKSLDYVAQRDHSAPRYSEYPAHDTASSYSAGNASRTALRRYTEYSTCRGRRGGRGGGGVFGMRRTTVAVGLAIGRSAVYAGIAMTRSLTYVCLIVRLVCFPVSDSDLCCSQVRRILDGRRTRASVSPGSGA